MHDVHPRTWRRRRRIVVASTVGFGLFALLLGSILRLEMYWGMALVVLVGFPNVFIGSPRMEANAEEEAALGEDPDDELAEIVSVEIYQDGVRTGIDRGLMSIVDNAIVFIGRRSDFVVGSEHLTPVSQKFAPYLPRRAYNSIVLALSHPEREIWLNITIIPGSPGEDTAESELLKTLPRFARNQKTPFLGEATFPPLTLAPTIAQELEQDLPSRPTIALIGALIALAGWQVTQEWIVAAVLGVVTGAFLFLWKEPERVLHRQKVLSSLPKPAQTARDVNRSHLIIRN